MSDNNKQKLSPSYRLAALDQDYILGDSMRGVRHLLEFTKVEERLRAWGIRSTIVVFGSSRRVARRDDTGRIDAPPGGPKAFVSHAAWWYEEARRFGRIASERGGAMTVNGGIRDNVIATGGGPGIMEAANRGAVEVGAPSIGFNIELKPPQQPNEFTTPELTFQFHYFAMRKMHLVMRAAALVAFPGGFGTLDELFELLTLVQTHKTPRIPIVCFDRDYWMRIVNFEALAEAGMISSADVGLLQFADSAERAWDLLVSTGLGAAATSMREAW